MSHGMNICSFRDMTHTEMTCHMALATFHDKNGPYRNAIPSVGTIKNRQDCTLGHHFRKDKSLNLTGLQKRSLV
jgi:hypothetical protein